MTTTKNETFDALTQQIRECYVPRTAAKIYATHLLEIIEDGAISSIKINFKNGENVEVQKH